MRMEKIQELMNELNAEIDKLSEDCVEVSADVGEGWEECGREDAEEYECRCSGGDWRQAWLKIKDCWEVSELDYRFRRRKQVPRNSDGDSIDDMKAVVAKLGKGAVTFLNSDGSGRCDGDFRYTVDHYRIAAKHSDTFNEACMDWGTWREAMSKKDVVFVHDDKDDTPSYFTSKGEALRKRFGLDMEKLHECCNSTCKWSVIPRAQYEQETKPKEPEFVPWDAETFPKDRPVWAKLAICRGDGVGALVIGFVSHGVTFSSEEGLDDDITWDDLLTDYVQHDGSPCGTLKKEGN